jgi:hypothetical protein
MQKPKQSSVPRLTKPKPMPKKRIPRERLEDAADDLDDEFEDRCLEMLAMVFDCATEAKGDYLTIEEEEAIVDWLSWYIICLWRGMDPVHWANAIRAEAKGTYTVH